MYSRLDFLLVSTHIVYDLKDANILPSIKSDHSLVKVTFGFKNSSQHGRGFWKFNSSLLKDPDYIDLVNTKINECIEKYDDLEDKSLKWDMIKCEIRGATVSYSSHLAKQRRSDERQLNSKLKTLEEEIDKSVNPEQKLIDEYNCTKEELEKIELHKTHGLLIRSRADWIEDGEKNTKYFLQLQNRNYKTKHIKTIIKDEKAITAPKDILAEEKCFYETLYAKRELKGKCDNECSLFNNKANILSNTDKESCEMVITLDECTNIVKSLENNKSPGSDGFTAEFYKTFWSMINLFVYESYLYAFKTGRLSIDQRRGVLTLLPKPQKDIRYLSNWRPISLLNTDFKILAKVLASRLQKVISSIISTDQSGYIKGRCIGENIRSILDIIEHSSSKINPGLMVFLDFEKAFDTVSWSFLTKTLKYFNFGENFIKWISILYQDITSCVVNNGTASSFFKVGRGIRQGCPISSLLFILVVEVLAINLRSNPKINALKFKNQAVLISQLADDTTLFIKDTPSLQSALLTLEHFHKCAGLKLNRSKTEILKLGASNNIDVSKTGIKEIESTRSLGIIITKNPKNTRNINLNERIKKIENLLQMWSARSLSIKGKITLLKSKVIPLILYTASVFYVPKETLIEMDRLLFKFIWPNGKHHVAKNVLIQDVGNGGLSMPDIESFIKAIKLTWIKRLVNTESNYSHIAKTMAHIDDFNTFFAHNLSVDLMSPKPTAFYKQIIEYWHEMKDKPKTVNEILNEKIRLNAQITIGTRTVNLKSINNSNKRILKDFLTSNFKIKSREQLNAEGTSLSIIEYNSLVTAIPREWLQQIKNKHEIFHELIDGYINVSNNIKHISTVACKEFYKELVKRKYVTSAAVHKWEELYFYINFDWSTLFRLPYMYARETSAQSLQYQIINRYYPCREIVGVWYPQEDKKCTTCDDCYDSLEHYFYQCAPVRKLWDEFMVFFSNMFRIHFSLSCLDVVFGIVNFCDDDILHVLNFCILQGKLFIKKKKSAQACIQFNAFKEALKERVIIEKYLYRKEGNYLNFLNKWEPLYNGLMA